MLNIATQTLVLVLASSGLFALYLFATMVFVLQPLEARLARIGIDYLGILDLCLGISVTLTIYTLLFIYGFLP